MGAQFPRIVKHVAGLFHAIIKMCGVSHGIQDFLVSQHLLISIRTSPKKIGG